MGHISSVKIRMYRMGTGDCFTLKFFEEENAVFKMMIDCGTWSGTKAKLQPYIEQLLSDMENRVDVLVVTHEHKDHVSVFDSCKESFADFKADRIWLGWTEDDNNTKVKQWKKDYGDQKKALAQAAQKWNNYLANDEFVKSVKQMGNGERTLSFYSAFSDSLQQLNELHNEQHNNSYIGSLAGMKFVKEEIGKKTNGNIEFFGPGDTLQLPQELGGMKFFFLGPPKNWENEISRTEGGKGESYDHNKELMKNVGFAAALLNDTNEEALIPFDNEYVLNTQANPAYESYTNEDNNWRRIDADWLQSAGSMGLRINSITNNLSLAFAIEFPEDHKVLLFPGDAEYGSWASWHTIPWKEQCRNGKPHFTEDLLSRTVFYKVAHHLSHNGTAKRLGLEMMTHPDLVAMATLDYNIISTNWRNTMPNITMINQLIEKTRGRLIVMNENGLFSDIKKTLPLTQQLEKALKTLPKSEFDHFHNNILKEEHFIEFTIIRREPEAIS